MASNTRTATSSNAKAKPSICVVVSLGMAQTTCANPGTYQTVTRAASKKTRVKIKHEKVSLGWAYRVYIDGTYMGTGLTLASARDGVKRMLVNYERRRRNSPVE